MKTRKLLSTLLAILMLTGIFSVGASALTSDSLAKTDVYVAGTLISEGYYLVEDGGITAENASASDYNVKFTPATESANAKLTFNNAKNIYQTVEIDDIRSVVLSGGALDVELLGENTLTNGDAAFASMGDISFIGSGSISYNGEGDVSYLVYTSSNITVGDYVKINLSPSEESNACGFLAVGTVTIKENADVNMKITGAGIYSEGGLTVCDNAKFTVDSSEIGHLAAEIYGDVTISGNAAVSLSTTREIYPHKAGDNDNFALRIRRKADLTVSDNATLNAFSGGGEQSVGICTEGSITVSGDAKLNASSGNTSRATLGIFIDYSNKDAVLTVKDNAQVTAKSGNIKGGDDCYPYNNGFASGGIEATNVTVSGNAKLTGIGGSATELDDGSVQNDCGGIYVAEQLIIEDSAVVKGVGGTANDISNGLHAHSIDISGDAKLEGISERSGGSSIAVASSLLNAQDDSAIIGKGSTSVTAASCGVSANSLTVTDNVTVDATASDGNTSFGIYTHQATFSANTEINAKSVDAKVTSIGIYSEVFSATDNVVINATGGNAEYTYGIATEQSEISGNTVITAHAGDGTARAIGFYMYSSGTVNGNAKLTVTAGKATKEYSAGIYSNGNVNIGGNAQVITTADAAEKSFGLAARTLTVASEAYIEAIGEKSAFYSENEINLEGCADPFIAVSDGTNSENATAWDGTSALGGENSEYKYVLIAPEAPAEPEPELSFFEQLLADISAFFTTVIAFLSSLFSFGG